MVSGETRCFVRDSVSELAISIRQLENAHPSIDNARPAHTHLQGLREHVVPSAPTPSRMENRQRDVFLHSGYLLKHEAHVELYDCPPADRPAQSLIEEVCFGLLAFRDIVIVHDAIPRPTAERRDEVVKRMLATPPQPKVSPKKKKTASFGASAPDGQPET